MPPLPLTLPDTDALVAAGSVPLCYVVLPVGGTTIKAVSDGTNGWIENVDYAVTR